LASALVGILDALQGDARSPGIVSASHKALQKCSPAAMSRGARVFNVCSMARSPGNFKVNLDSVCILPAERDARTGDASNYSRCHLSRARPILAFVTSRAQRGISTHVRPYLRGSTVDLAGARPGDIFSKPGTPLRLELGLPDAGLSGQPSFPRASAYRADL
jgi:hypothetical protein